MTTSVATATWKGKLKDGQGTFSGRSGAFQGPYTFATRFEGARGTNPEELIAAAHAACLSMALSAGLERAGTPATSITTTASCTIDMVDGAPKITTMKLAVRGKVPGLDGPAFVRAATDAKENCPVSKALKASVQLEFDAALES